MVQTNSSTKNGMSTQVFLLKNRMVGVGMLLSIPRTCRHCWKNGESCLFQETKGRLKRVFAVTTVCLFGFLSGSSHYATRRAKLSDGMEQALTSKSLSKPSDNF